MKAILVLLALCSAASGQHKNNKAFSPVEHDALLSEPIHGPVCAGGFQQRGMRCEGEYTIAFQFGMFSDLECHMSRGSDDWGQKYELACSYSILAPEIPERTALIEEEKHGK